MTTSGKKFRKAAEKVDRNKRYTVEEGFKLLKETVELTKTKFDQTVDLAVNLGVDPKHALQSVEPAFSHPRRESTHATSGVTVLKAGARWRAVLLVLDELQDRL